MDRHRRTLIKTVTWRLSAFLVTWIVVYLFRHDVRESTWISLIANGLKTALYYLHERVWNKVPFGRNV